MKKLKIATSMIAAMFFAAAAVQADVFTISTNAPTVNVVESFNTLDYTNTTATLAGMGPNRIELSGTQNRYAGQSVTIAPTNNVQADSITFRSYSTINFNDGGTNTFELYIVANNVTAGSYTYDFSTNSIVKGDYMTFDLGGVALNAGVEYEFQMYYSEFDDDNKLGFERDQGGDSYAGGALFSGSDTNAAIVMPKDNVSLSGTSDMTFFLQGTATPYTPPVTQIEVSATAPTADVLESYDATANLSSMSPRRKVTQTVPNRTLGQTFTVTNEIFSIDALTLFGKNAINFSGDGGTHTFLIAFMKETSNDSATDKYIETFAYDMSGQNVAADERYITFNLDSPMSNLVAGTYSFELWWGEENDLNDKAFERSKDVDHYAGGGQISKSPATVFPNANMSPNGTADMTFYIHGSDEASMPVVHTASTNKPNTDILESFEVSSDLAGWGPTRLEEPTLTNANNRVIGQTFTLDHAGEVTLTAITVRQHPEWNGDFRDANTHTFLVAVSADTDGNGKGDAPLGTFEYDFTSEYFNQGEYFTFHLGEGISGVTGGTYQIEYYWGEVDPDRNNFGLERSKANNNYVDGAEYSAQAYNGAVNGFPSLEIGNLNAASDLTFFIQGIVEVSADPYADWAGGYPGFTDTDQESDPEGDGLNNLMEYALNGDPMINDAGSVKPGTSTDGSWFIHVHTERVGDSSLSYAVELDQNANLSSASWATNGIDPVAESAVSGDYKSVTNRTDATGAKEFVRLKVEKN